MRRFEVALFGSTVIAHAPLIALFGLRFGLVGFATGASVTAIVTWLLRGRLALAYDDRPIAPRRRALEQMYYVLWIGAYFWFVLTPIGLLVALATPLDAVGGLALSGAAAIALATFAVAVRPYRVKVRRLDVAIRDLPEGLIGMTIAQLSDLHVGSMFPPSHVKRWVDLTNALAPDIIALTGDYVTSGTRFQAAAAEALASLRAELGAFAVLGNHDDFGGGEPFRSTLARTDVRLLQNEHLILERRQTRFVLAGVDDVYTRRADISRTLEGAPDLTTIVLAHDPRLFPEIAARRRALVLSGHTHWGQLGIPFLAARMNIGRIVYPFSADRHHLDESVLHVHPGLGTTGPPVRLGVAPEIVLLTLTRA